MRIVSARPLVLGTPWRNLTYLVVETDEGISGVGEVRMMNHTDALLGYLAEALPIHVIGADPFAIEDLVQRMTRRDFARPGEIAMSALAVVETACWDIVGKALDRPVYELLGGAVRESIPAYANGWYRVARTPDDFHRAARDAVELGYTALKVDPFGTAWMRLDRADLSAAVALIEAVRDGAGPDVELLIEMHGRFTVAQAVKATRALERFEPGWIEEPVPPQDIPGIAAVARKVDVPVAAGERIHHRHEFRELFEQRAVSVVQPDHTMCGGLLETRKIASWAESYGILVAPHNVGGPVSTAAALHLGAGMPNFLVQEYFNDFDDAYVTEVGIGAPTPRDGAFALPQGPGLGVVLDEELLAAHPRTEHHFDLYQDDWQLRKGATSR